MCQTCLTVTPEDLTSVMALTSAQDTPTTALRCEHVLIDFVKGPYLTIDVRLVFRGEYLYAMGIIFNSERCMCGLL